MGLERMDSGVEPVVYLPWGVHIWICFAGQGGEKQELWNMVEACFTYLPTYVYVWARLVFHIHSVGCWLMLTMIPNG